MFDNSYQQIVYERLLSHEGFMSPAELHEVLPYQLQGIVTPLCYELYDKALVIARFSLDGRSIAVNKSRIGTYEIIGQNIHDVIGSIGVDEHNWLRVKKTWGAVLRYELTPRCLPEGVQLGQVYVDPTAT